MFTVSKETMERKLKEYTKKIPKPLNRQFPERLSKAAAIEKKKQRDEDCVQVDSTRYLKSVQ